MDWELIIKNTLFHEKTDCIVSVLNRMNVVSLEQARNLPANVKTHFCGVDVFKLVEEINRIFSEGIPVEVEEPEETPEEEDKNMEEIEHGDNWSR